MITRDIPPVDGGGRIPQPIKPDPNKNGQNTGPTVSQDMAAIVAQSGQVFYVPTQILPDDNSDRGHDSSTSSNKNTHKEKKNTDSNLHFPNNNKEFKTLSATVTNWVQSMQDNLLVAEGPAQDPNNVVLGAEDEVHYVEPPKMSYTSTVSGNNKMSEFVDTWADFISTFDFSSMSGSKGMVAWAMMMNYVKSAIWASALTSGDIEALMEQFKAMIEQLKSTADVKKTLALAQADQVGKQIETLDNEGMAAIAAAWKNIATSALGIGLSMASGMSKETKKDSIGSIMNDKPEDSRLGSSHSVVGKANPKNWWDNTMNENVKKAQGLNATQQKMNEYVEKGTKVDTELDVILKPYELDAADKEKGYDFTHDVKIEAMGGVPERTVTLKCNSSDAYKDSKEGNDVMVALSSDGNKMAKFADGYSKHYEQYAKRYGIDTNSEEYKKYLKLKSGDHKAVLMEVYKLPELIKAAVEHKNADIPKVKLYAHMMKDLKSAISPLHEQYAPGPIPGHAYAEAMTGVLKNYEMDPKYSAPEYKPVFEGFVKEFNGKYSVELKTWGSCALPERGDPVVEALYIEKRRVAGGHDDNHELLDAHLEAHYTKDGRTHEEVIELVNRKKADLQERYDQYCETHNTYNHIDGSDEELALKKQLFQSGDYEDGVVASFNTAVLANPQAFYDDWVIGSPREGKLGYFDQKLHEAAKDLNLQINGLKQVEDTARGVKQANASAQAKANPKQTFSPELIGQIFNTLATCFKVQQDKYNLLKERNNLVAETAKQIISGEREASSQMLEGMLQIMQKVLDALVTMNQNLRQTATQSAASLQISTF
jgi:hypothetical protein